MDDEEQAVDARRRVGCRRRPRGNHARRRQRRHPGCVRHRHGGGGILGALLTGIFVSPALGGPSVVSDWVTGKTEFPGYMAQLWIQAKAVGITIIWSGVVAYVSYKIVDMTVGLRVPEDEEREGLDISSHGESAYQM